MILSLATFLWAVKRNKRPDRLIATAYETILISSTCIQSAISKQKNYLYQNDIHMLGDEKARLDYHARIFCLDMRVACPW